jgi:hypothetical protein
MSTGTQRPCKPENDDPNGAKAAPRTGSVAHAYPEHDVSPRHGFRQMLGHGRKSSNTSVPTVNDVPGEAKSQTRDSAKPKVFWPRDLLTHERWCQAARILTYGYDSKVTKAYANSNKNNLFVHAKDLLHALEREKPKRRPVIFVAHSLGGLVVKEVNNISTSLERIPCVTEIVSFRAKLFETLSIIEQLMTFLRSYVGPRPLKRKPSRYSPIDYWHYLHGNTP